MTDDEPDRSKPASSEARRVVRTQETAQVPASSGEGGSEPASSAEGGSEPAAKRPNVFVRGGKRVGNQAARIILLVSIVVISGMAVGYTLGYPLRYVNYEASSAVSLDQASLAGTVDVDAALVAADDLGPGWVAGDPSLGSFGVLGADVCGEVIETPTPLSAKEAAVWVDETNGARIISQALRVDKWKAAEEYVDDVADGLEECETFFRTDGEETVKVTSTDIDRDPPITDHVDRRYQSPTGVQEWSLMAVGDVIIAIQYLAATPPPEGFVEEIERSVLARVAPREFTPGGVGSPQPQGNADPTAATTEGAEVDTGAADESGGP